jgi:hypothetical protein
MKTLYKILKFNCPKCGRKKQLDFCADSADLDVYQCLGCHHIITVYTFDGRVIEVEERENKHYA